MKCGSPAVQSYVRQVELFAAWLRRRRTLVTVVTDDDIRAFIRRQLRRAPATRQSAIRYLVAHLRQQQLVPPSPTPRAEPADRVVAEFDAHLRDPAGLADATRLYSRRYAREFLRSVFGTGPIDWSRIQPQHVRAYVAGYGTTGRLAAARVAAGAIRSFLRWLEFVAESTPAWWPPRRRFGGGDMRRCHIHSPTNSTGAFWPSTTGPRRRADGTTR